MYLAYTYHIKHKITGQYYYGYRCKNIKLKLSPQEDFWIKYFTSSDEVKNLIDKYGKESFEINIVMEDEDSNKCYRYEQILISQNLRDPGCLNRYCDLTGKFSTAGKPSPLKGKTSPLKGRSTGRPSTRKGTKTNAPSSCKGKPSKNKGRPSPKKGMTGSKRQYLSDGSFIMVKPNT